jgi:hypothetical protein
MIQQKSIFDTEGQIPILNQDPFQIRPMEDIHANPRNVTR